MKMTQFPLTRHVLIEKINSKKSLKEGWWRVEFSGFKNDENETFIVDSLSPISTNTRGIYAGFPGNVYEYVATKQEWSPISFRILEYEGMGSGEKLSKWINAYMFPEGNFSFPPACSIKLSNESGYNWMLSGCIPKTINDENGLITLELEINHAVLS